MRFETRLDTQPVIPMVGMADIAFLLIVFFMLTSTFSKDTGLDISLPSAATIDALPRREISIWVTNEGQVLVDRVPVPPEQVPVYLAAQLQQTSLKAVTIRGDERVNYGVIVDIMDVSKQLGASITLAAVYEEPQGGSQ
jgi:biopolymer transport protein ExbD